MIEGLRVFFAPDEKTVENVEKFLSIIDAKNWGCDATSSFIEETEDCFLYYDDGFNRYIRGRATRLNGTEISFTEFLKEYDTKEPFTVTEHEGYTKPGVKAELFAGEDTKHSNVSDGGSNSFYVFPEWVCNIDSLNRYWRTSSAEGNILKSLCANLGSRHGGTDKKREVRKSLHYAVERMRWEGFSDEDILAQVQKQIDDAKNQSA